MAAHRLSAEIYVCWALPGLLFLLIAVVGLWKFLDARQTITLHARMPEQGGWNITTLETEAGKPLHLRLVSDDVLHGFAIGQSEQPEIVLYPGKPTETTLIFDKPGAYTFYCTRWCGPNHWRMRGTIVVSGSEQADVAPQPPLFVTLGLDIDAPHPAPVLPSAGVPSPEAGAPLLDLLPSQYRSQEYYRTHSPVQTWQALRTEQSLQTLDDSQLWNAVVALWQQAAVPSAYTQGRDLYAKNCAACHGAQGRGDGPFAQSPSPSELSDLTAPPDLSDLSFALGASPAMWQGKILRGGMGTGMPSWGAIFTEEQIWALTDYLWTFSLLSNP